MKITKCRICGGVHFEEIINLGKQKFTGIFPASVAEPVWGGELRLVKCVTDGGCGLVQLDETFNLNQMYGENYGYHSSLNSSMVDHLEEIVSEAVGRVKLNEKDFIIDIGSNDGTLLSRYLTTGRSDMKLLLLGIDPTGSKFRKYYKEGIMLVEDFFSADAIAKAMPGRKAQIVTSIAMFYDLEDPIAFAKDVRKVLDNNGIWIMEQSYLPLMVERNAYDTVCHEHVEFYSLKQIDYIAGHAGLKIIDVSLNDTNGGSFRVTLAKQESHYGISCVVNKLLRKEISDCVDTISYFDNFVNNIKRNKTELLSFLNDAKKNKKIVLGYGASTKGNVILQYCDIGTDLISAIVEVNPDKYGHVTPGTNIPIISEEEGRKRNPDYLVVFPWHFKCNILNKEANYIKESGVKFVFPLPEVEVI